MSLDLIRKHEPVLRFARGENFFPMTVEEYVPYCSLHVIQEDRGVLRIPPPFVDLQSLADFSARGHYLVYADRRAVDPTAEEALRKWLERKQSERGLDYRKLLYNLKEKAFELGLDLQKIFFPLNLPREVFEQAVANYGGINDRPPAYYFRIVQDGEYTVLQYWFFYAYNDFATSHGGVNDHEGDWEVVMVFLRNGEPVWMTCSAHMAEGQKLGRQFNTNVMELEGDHPVIYVAAGSHACYQSPETHLPDKAFIPGEIVIGGASGRPWAEPQDLEQPWFTEFKGRWGAYQFGFRHEMADAGGGPPSGPKFNRDGSMRKQWDRPVEYAGLR